MHAHSETPTSVTASPKSPFRMGSQIAAVVVVVLLFAALYSRWISIPHPVRAYVELESHIDRCVEFVGVFDGSDKGYDLIIFEGNSILFNHSLGARDWSPDTDGECKVIGTLKRFNRHLYGVEKKVDYKLSEAEFFPVDSDVAIAPNK